MPLLTKQGEYKMRLEDNAELLKRAGYVEITDGNHLIYIQENSNGGFDGSVYIEKDYTEDNDIDCIDGGVFEDDSAVDAIKFFIEMAEDLVKGGN